MKPHLPRRAAPASPLALAPAVALALTAASIGCDPPRARSFAVILDEPEPARCLPAVPGDPADLDVFDDGWTPTWTVDDDPGILDPVGGTLRVAPSDEGGTAWFEGFDDPPHRTWNNVVFEGEVAGDHLEVKSAGSYLPAASDPGSTASRCEELARFDAELVVTIDGPELDGMLWRKEQRPLASGELACLPHLVCSSEIRVTGVEDR